MTGKCKTTMNKEKKLSVSGINTELNLLPFCRCVHQKSLISVNCLTLPDNSRGRVIPADADIHLAPAESLYTVLDGTAHEHM